MPITKSAQKALRQSAKRRAGNRRVVKRMRATVKKVRELSSSNQKAEATTLLPTLYKNIDKAAKKGVIKKNNASRKKARLTKMLQSEQQAK